MTETTVTEAIDVHAHFGQHDLHEMDRVDQWCSGDAGVVARRGRSAGIRWSIASALTALCPFRGNILEGNQEASRAVEEHEGLLFWAVADPLRQESLVQAQDLLENPKCMGIKMHPFLHQYEARVHAGPVFELAARYQTVILTHSGDKGSYPEDFVDWANRFPEARLIVAHLGHGDDGCRSRQVRAAQAAKHQNMWIDTSSATSMLSGLIEWAVGELGDTRLLFGTDTPLYFSACQKTRIEAAEISEDSKYRILWQNAQELFQEKICSLK